MNKNFFEGNISFIDEAISKRLYQIENPEPNFRLKGIYQDLYTYNYRKVECFYSMGYPVEDLLPVYRECLSALCISSTPKRKTSFL